MLIWLFVFADLLTVALAVPMLMRRLPRNRTYGFRTPKTLSSDEIWYPANAVAGRNMVIGGVFALLATLVAAATLSYLTAVLAASLVLTVSVLGALLFSLRSLERLG